MQKINKDSDEVALIDKKLDTYTGNNWQTISFKDKAYVREHLKKEQHWLCCYCCQNIENKNVHIEHLKSKHEYAHLCFKYENLLLSCDISNKHCGHAKGTKELSLTPLMIECNSEIRMNLAGELIAKSDRAKEAISILNLNMDTLRRKRENLINAYKFVFDPIKPYDKPTKIVNEAMLQMIIADLPSTGQKSELEYIINKLT